MSDAEVWPRVPIKNLTYAYARVPGLSGNDIRYQEFFLNKAGKLVQRDVLGHHKPVPPPYDLELPSPVGQIVRRVN
jgi:uncharacterized protein YecE (DUF72 family)